MSTAEVKAREFFDAHYIADNALEERCMMAYQQASMGYAKPIEDFFQIAESEYPWLSE